MKRKHKNNDDVAIAIAACEAVVTIRVEAGLGRPPWEGGGGVATPRLLL